MSTATAKKKLKIEPLGDRIIIRREEADEKATPGGRIVLPDSVREHERPSKGEVLAIGPKIESVAVGDVVYYTKYAGDEITQDEVEYTILREGDVMCVLESEG